MKRFLLLAALASILVVSSCKKEDGGPLSKELLLEDINVPDGFDWATIKSVKFNISITDNRFANAEHTISVYDGDPANGGHVVATGTATLVSAFKETINFPSAVKEVYVVKKSPDGSVVTQQVQVTGAEIAIAFGAQKGNTSISSVSGKGIAAIKADNGTCPNGAVQISANLPWTAVNAGVTYCIFGNVSIQGMTIEGTVRIYGNVSSSNLSVKNGGKLYIINGGSFTGQIYGESGSYVENNGQLEASGNNGSFSTGGVFVNTGILKAQSFSVNSGSRFTNSGTVNVSSAASIVGANCANSGTFNIGGSFSVNSESSNFINSGTITVGGDMAVNGQGGENNHKIDVAGNFFLNSNSASYINKCMLLVGKEFFANAVMNNYGYIDVKVKSTLNSNGTLKMYSAAMFSTKDMSMNSTIIGDGNASLVKVTGTTSANVTKVSNGAFYLDLYANPSASYNIYIPVSECNSEGYGTPPVSYTKSVNYDNGGSTLVFEDNWPVKGDFDLNDIVLSYKYIITKTNNKATKIEASYTLLASGGEYKNGFGIEFPTAAGNVELTAKNNAGIGLESGQQNAVVVLFQNARDVQANWNTIKGNPTSAPVTFTFTLTFKTPVSLENNAFNPFIFQKGTGGKRNEVHLPGLNGTALANAVLGSGDNSATMTYVTKDKGLPWAINLPVSNFKYPLEKINIATAYRYIVDWARSGGIEEVNWYEKADTEKCYPVE